MREMTTPLSSEASNEIESHIPYAANQKKLLRKAIDLHLLGLIETIAENGKQLLEP
jgi:hypothetical protein